MTRNAYPVGIVGEASYQPAIRRCSRGERVQILRQPDNPYDSDALAVVTSAGETIGYIPRDCWLQEAIHDEGKGCAATIKEIQKGGGGSFGVVLDVWLTPGGVGECSFSRAPVSEARKSWLSRLFGL